MLIILVNKKVHTPLAEVKCKGQSSRVMISCLTLEYDDKIQFFVFIGYDDKWTTSKL